MFSSSGIPFKWRDEFEELGMAWAVTRGSCDFIRGSERTGNGTVLISKRGLFFTMAAYEGGDLFTPVKKGFFVVTGELSGISLVIMVTGCTCLWDVEELRAERKGFSECLGLFRGEILPLGIFGEYTENMIGESKRYYWDEETYIPVFLFDWDNLLMACFF